MSLIFHVFALFFRRAESEYNFYFCNKISECEYYFLQGLKHPLVFYVQWQNGSDHLEDFLKHITVNFHMYNKYTGRRWKWAFGTRKQNSKENTAEFFFFNFTRGKTIAWEHLFKNHRENGINNIDFRSNNIFLEIFWINKYFNIKHSGMC